MAVLFMRSDNKPGTYLAGLHLRGSIIPRHMIATPDATSAAATRPVGCVETIHRMELCRYFTHPCPQNLTVV